MVTLQLKATLKDVDENPLSNKTINFYYSYDKQTWNLIESKSTDENGVASTTFEANQTTHFKAYFEGDENYDPSVAYATYEYEAPAPTPTYEAYMTSFINMMTFMLIVMLIIELIGLIRE